VGQGPVLAEEGDRLAAAKPAVLKPTLLSCATSENGSGYARIRLSGTAGHASLVGEGRPNAIAMAAAFIDRHLPLVKLAATSVGKIMGGHRLIPCRPVAMLI
jgi:acetylornithine deacetylase/succinyl-diaminopimelate desuccinylase-like protein